MAKHKVWVTDDLLTALNLAGESGRNTVAVGLWHKLTLARDKVKCKHTGFWWSGWTMVSLTEAEEHCLRRLRPACFVKEDA